LPILRLHTRAFFKDYLAIFHTTSSSTSSTPVAGAIQHWGLQFKPLQGGTAGGSEAGRRGGGEGFCFTGVTTGESDSTVWGLKKGEMKQERQVWFLSHAHTHSRTRTHTHTHFYTGLVSFSLAAADAAFAKSHR